jgi:hypothetical protein
VDAGLGRSDADVPRPGSSTLVVGLSRRSNTLVWLAQDGAEVVRIDEEPASVFRRLVSELLRWFTPDHLL